MSDKSRGLTQGEIDLAKGIFGASIDYGKVRIHDGKIPGFLESKFQPDFMPVPYDANDIYSPQKVYSEDMSKGDRGEFIHLMAYIWQFQNNITTPEAVKKWGIDNRNNLEALSQATADPKKDLKDYNVEQRAALIERLFHYREAEAHPPAAQPADPTGSQFLKKYSAAAQKNPNDLMVKWMGHALNITKDANGQYHLDPKAWAQAQSNMKSEQAKDAQEQKDTMQVLARFIADPSYLTPGHRPAPQPPKPRASVPQS